MGEARATQGRTQPVKVATTTMTLGNLISRLPANVLEPLAPDFGAARAVHEIAYDSRRVSPAAIFVAMRGVQSDGHRFLADAARAGAAALVGENAEALRAAAAPGDIPAFVAANPRRALAELSCALYDHPSRTMDIIGITGTNGKTTTAHLVERLYAALGFQTGRIGTLGAKIGDEEMEGAHTTPEAPDLQKLLRRMSDAGVQKVAMEVSSHALAQDRAWGTRFPSVVYTNLTQDHLDYHADMEDYFRAKERLFTDYEPLGEGGRAVINADDAYGRRLLEGSRREATAYGIHGGQVGARDVRPTPGGSAFTLECAGACYPVRLRLPGLFNVYNALAALAAVQGETGESLEALLPLLESLTGAPGRFEAVDRGQDFTVLVDYAHTPDALENVLRAAREVTKGRVLAVFGCGGDRDRAKRPKMGRIGVAESDLTFITSDNPRTEEPEAIIRDIVAGLNAATNYTVDADRRAAIFAAIHEAKPGDTVVIAGKGHEDYQILGTVKHHFDDREVAAEALDARRNRP